MRCKLKMQIYAEVLSQGEFLFDDVYVIILLG